MNLTRRQILQGVGASFLLQSAGCSIFGGSGGGTDLTVRQQKPLNAEPRLDHLFDSWITPTRYFYVRCHGNLPDIDVAKYALIVEGLVDRPLKLPLGDLEKFARVSVPSTLECAGNRRSEHSRTKTTGGVQWDAGAIGNAEWRGVRLSEVLERAGVKSGAKFVWFEGLDTVTIKDRQTLFGGEVPLEKALLPETIVALEMNGEPLSREHGAPVRTVVPGYIGARSVKWLGRIVVADHSWENNFVGRDYKLFPPDVTPETVKAELYDPIYEYGLNSAICRPLAGQTVDAGRLQVSGYAIAPGSAGVSLAGIEVSADAGASWVSARLMSNDAPYTWRLWSAEVNVPAGPRTLVVRAKDSKGRVQPEQTPWNFKGYLYGGWHRVPITVV